MAKLPVLSARKILRALEAAGFSVVRQRGSHIRLNGAWGGRPRIVIVPNHPEVAPGTLQSILRQAVWTKEDLISHLR
ncbi:MAG TPA: type II toxin-antitoxin system HicA family toxin [Candidatus Thermoplasmatota archaeon]|nr:type II toxin-antitoxin system HicA family toxin [Candidatus Thermoplasmatota archaeon]